MSKKTPLVGGNWKCNLKLAEVKSLVADVYNKMEFDSSRCDVFCAPVALHIPEVLSTVNSKVSVAAQNSSLTGMGAFTGEHRYFTPPNYSNLKFLARNT